ncbi:fatty acid synthase subunit alpha reductase [Ilyonectria robusta]
MFHLLPHLCHRLGRLTLVISNIVVGWSRLVNWVSCVNRANSGTQTLAGPFLPLVVSRSGVMSSCWTVSTRACNSSSRASNCDGLIWSSTSVASAARHNLLTQARAGLQSPRRAGGVLAHRPGLDGSSAPSSQSSFAGRWSAKEAVFKSLGVASQGAGAALKDIEILKGETGAPTVSLHGDAAAAAKKAGVKDITVSISHSDSQAIAVAVASF